MSKDNSNFPINPYKHSIRNKEDNQTDNFTAEKKTPDFSEFFQVPNEVKEAIDITYVGSIKLVISEMSNISFKSGSTGNNYNKSDKM